MKLLAWHRWLGLTLGAFIAIQGLGGALLLFRAPLNRLLHPDAFVQGVTFTLDADVAVVRGTGCAINRIDLPHREDAPLFFHLSCGGDAFMATAAGGRIYRLAPLWQWPVEWLFQFHYRLAVGAVGQQLVGWIGVALLSVCVTAGLLLWRTVRREGWGALVRPGWRAAPVRRWRDLHRTAGFALLPLLLLVALTGVGMAWTRTLTALLPTIPRPSPLVAARPDTPLLPLARILDKVTGAPVASIRFPGGHRRVVLVVQGAVGDDAYAQSWFNGYDGGLLANRRGVDGGAGGRIMDMLYPLHTGGLLGAAGPFVMLPMGLALPLLWGTGLYLWQKRRRKGTLRVRVCGLVPDGAGVLHITLCRPWGLPLPLTTAGDHIDLHLPTGLVRQYSLCGPPGRRRRWQIAVHLSRASTGGSVWLHQHLALGMSLRVGRPRRHFQLRDGDEPVLLLAAGIGVTPLLSMAWTLWERDRPFTLVISARGPAARPLARVIASTPFAAHCHWHDSALRGRIDLACLLAAQSPGTSAYVCGPAGFITAVQAAARDRNWPDSRLHWESFGAATPAGPTFSVHLDGRDLQVAAGESLLDRLLRDGFAVPHSCRRGLCGQCVVTVLAGAVDHRDSILTAAERADGQMTSCCSRAAGEQGHLHLSLSPPC